MFIHCLRYYKINNIYVKSNYLNKNFCLINDDKISAALCINHKAAFFIQNQQFYSICNAIYLQITNLVI